MIIESIKSFSYNVTYLDIFILFYIAGVFATIVGISSAWSINLFREDSDRTAMGNGLYIIGISFLWPVMYIVAISYAYFKKEKEEENDSE